MTTVTIVWVDAHRLLELTCTVVLIAAQPRVIPLKCAEGDLVFVSSVSIDLLTSDCVELCSGDTANDHCDDCLGGCTSSAGTHLHCGVDCSATACDSTEVC